MIYENSTILDNYHLRDTFTLLGTLASCFSDLWSLYNDRWGKWFWEWFIADVIVIAFCICLFACPVVYPSIYICPFLRNCLFCLSFLSVHLCFLLSFCVSLFFCFPSYLSLSWCTWGEVQNLVVQAGSAEAADDPADWVATLENENDGKQFGNFLLNSISLSALPLSVNGLSPDCANPL